MKVLVTGGNGFVGRALVQRLLTDPAIEQLTVVDCMVDGLPDDPRITAVSGSIVDTGVLEQAFAGRPEVIYHLASIPGGAAEDNYELGLDVNLRATLAMLELARLQSEEQSQEQSQAQSQDLSQRQRPLFLFSSSIAVYGAPMPDPVTDDSTMNPLLSYGAQKLAAEVLVKDYHRRGWIDARILRLPGIVARPPQPSGLRSAFMSDLFWKLSAAEPMVCPVSPDAVAWWMSVGCCVDNLIHAATDRDPAWEQRCDYTLPVLRLTVGEVVAGLAERFGQDRAESVEYQPDAALEKVFGRFPMLDSSAALAVGFKHDGDIQSLISRALYRQVV
ncbi:NAD-dependent epimerase/dehydratase family protein [Marinobacterium mangrovicola]|uniref:Nucleoside-diphosphate-sugar epimerase n=1 Tax=Marinobacterium mangrovicola TaxID=1476959 RepID=A0A4R1GMQ0_9GAMM|nr:NAD-dependent epimerase/dehydratase family protein [Marinobacterium mangrovicola]TCK07559.1 nucleoside-diphosphate-sugar epimerase [Marinobacterium mangrovicola]